MNEVRTVYGVGYLGDNAVTVDENGVRKKSYTAWKDMLRRVYHRPNEKEAKKHRSYENCSVCEEWHCFAIFEKDIETIPGYNEWLKGEVQYSLDKDLLQEGKEFKIYSPSTCVFIPKSQNSKLTQKQRGSYVSFDIKNDFAFEVHHGLGQFQSKQSQICKCVNHVTKTSCGRKWYKLEEAQELLQVLFNKAKQIDWYALSVEDYQQAYDMLRQGDWNELNEFYDEIFEKYGFRHISQCNL